MRNDRVGLTIGDVGVGMSREICQGLRARLHHHVERLELGLYIGRWIIERNGTQERSTEACSSSRPVTA